MAKLSHKTTQLLLATAKILVVILAIYFIYLKLRESSFKELSNQVQDIPVISLYSYIIITVLMTVINWLLEIKKWQELVIYIKDLSFTESAKQTLTAHLLGFITPAKSGDYGAKALFYKSTERKKILFLNFIGNMYQLKATLVFGFIGLGIIALFTSGTAIFFWGLGIFMTFVLYQVIPKVLRSVRWTLNGNAWYKIKRFWKSLPSQTKKSVQLLSSVRYLVFSHQFYFILWVFDARISYPFAMACITAMYLLSSLVPVMQLFDVIVRGGIAVWIFSWYGVSEEIVLITILIMWLCNMGLPLIFGGYFLFKTKITQKANVISK